jgi:predicted nuclease of predicted toxin-antitoxin system
MGLAQSTARHLKTRGHDVVHLRDEGLERLPDDQIVAKAIAEHRAIITHDLDFGRIVALSGDSVPSILTLRLTDMTPANVNPALDLALESASPAIGRGALVTVSDQGIRIRPLPVAGATSGGTPPHSG